MQIGDRDLDRVCAEAIVPALEACGLAARRVDKHNEGGLLKSEIIRFLQESDIIIADLTNERPNVYLEIGYAMGLDKFRQLLLMAREDHFTDSPNHMTNGPKIHFDLAGYDILAWQQDKVPELRTELEKRIRRRLAVVGQRSLQATPTWNDTWIGLQRESALVGLANSGRSGYMEVRAALSPPKLAKTQTELNEAAQQAPIHTFGWPIGIYLHKDGAKPVPRADGISAEVKGSQESYDYWTIRRDGDFYFLGSLFEDERTSGKLFFDTRIVRVTEAVLYCLRLYSALGVDRAHTLSIAIRFGGLRDRTLTSATGRRSLSFDRQSHEDISDAEVTGTLDEIEAHLLERVKDLIAPTFTLFDFFALGDPVYAEIVNNFAAGRIV